MAGLLSGMALMLAMLALSHRWERRLLLVAGACLCLAGLLVPSGAHASSQLALQLLLGVSLLALLARQSGLKLHHGERLALVVVVLLWSLAAFGPAGWASRLQSLLPSVLGASLLLLSAWFLWRRWRGWMRDGLNSWAEVGEQVRFTVLPLLVATSVGGLLMHSAVRARPPFSVILLMLLLGAALAHGFGRRRMQSDQRLRQAEQHYQDRLVEMERHHQQLSDQRLEQVTERERKRIAGDLHDDLGAKLLTIVHTSDIRSHLNPGARSA